MNRIGFILKLLVVVLIGSLPLRVLAENGLSGLIKTQEKKLEQNRANATLLLQLAREIRQQRAEVLFWFRIHPTERVFPQKEVDRMLNSGATIRLQWRA